MKGWKLNIMVKLRPINNEEQNQHTIIVPDTQDVPNNEVEENVTNSVRDNFFLHGQGATKANKRTN